LNIAIVFLGPAPDPMVPLCGRFNAFKASQN
jgi:hypothetical protein